MINFQSPIFVKSIFISYLNYVRIKYLGLASWKMDTFHGKQPLTQCFVLQLEFPPVLSNPSSLNHFQVIPYSLCTFPSNQMLSYLRSLLLSFRSISIAVSHSVRSSQCLLCICHTLISYYLIAVLSLSFSDILHRASGPAPFIPCLYVPGSNLLC